MSSSYGTISGANWASDTESKIALYFDGSDDYVNTYFGNGINPYDDKLEIRVRCKIKKSDAKFILFGVQSPSSRVYVGSEDGSIWDFPNRADSLLFNRTSLRFL